jgi:hypothetical protein
MINQIVTWLLGSDPAELVGEGNWRFGFVARYGNYVNLLLIVLFLAMVYLIVRSYRREGDNPPGVKASLATIRVLVCLLVLGVLFRPAIVLRFTRTVYSTVVLLIDDSRSMSFTDRYGDANEQASLSAIMGADRASLENVSRTDIIRRVLGRQGGLVEKLAENHPLMLMRFSTDKQGREAYTRPLGRLAGPAGIAEAQGQAATTQPTSAPATPRDILARLTSSGFETDLPAALRDSMESVLGRRIAGIVMISDGQMTTRSGEDRLADAMAYANQRGLRIYPVLVGDPTPPKNVSVTGLQAPREVRRGAHTEFSVVLAHRNLTGQQVRVKLLRKPAEAPQGTADKNDWADTGIAKTARLDGEGAAGSSAAGGVSHGVQTVALEVEPDTIGKFIYRAVVEPHPDERNVEDNQADAPVDVSDEKIRVLIVSGDAGWEFQYIRNFLHRQPDLYRLSVWQQDADKEVNQLASTGMKIDHLPREFKELGSDGNSSNSEGKYPGYDVVILCDPQPTLDGFDENFIKILRKFVEVHGGGLCYVAGGKYSDLVLSARGSYGDLSDMLPVVPAANTGDTVERILYRRPQAWPVRLTDYGLDHPITRLASTVADSAKIWDILPGIYWSHPVLKAKPLARVLAVSSNPARHTDRNEPEPLLATQPFGVGRALYVGFDETWRWRYVQEGRMHQAFWDNVVRYLASLRTKQVVITAGGDQFSAGERITIEVEAFDENFNPRKDDSFDVEMVDTQTGASETIVCKSVPDKPGRYKATLRASKTGAFQLTALKGDPLAGDKVQPKTIRIDLPKAEALRTEADRATMENLATRAENFRTIDRADDLARLIPDDRKTAVREVPRELWNSNLMLLTIVLLLTAEWILRKKYNMA